MKAYPAYKESGNDFIGAIPEHWEVFSLKHLLKDGNDGIKIGPFGSSLKLEIIKEDGYKVYGQGNVINNDFEWGHRHIDDDKFSEMSVYELFPDDIIITMMGTTGKAKVVPQNIKRGIFDSHIIRIRVNNKTFSSFVSMLINDSYYVFNQIKINSKGSIMEGLNSAIIKSLQIALPPLPEQQAIADFLDRKTRQIDTLIAKKQRQIELLQEQRAALINQAVTKGLNPSAPMKDSGVEWLGEIPSHWEVKQMRHCASIEYGISMALEKGVTNEIPILTLRNIKFDGEFDLTDISSISRDEMKSDDLFLKKGDLLFNWRNGSSSHIGKTAYFDLEGQYTFVSFLLRLRTNSTMDARFLQTYLNGLRSAGFFATSKEQVNRTFNASELGRLQVLIPPISEQAEIKEFIETEIPKVDNLVEFIKRQIELLQEYRTALIAEAVTGKIDVRA